MLILAQTHQSFAQEVLTGQAAANLFGSAEMVRTSNHSSVPSYLKFKQGKELDLDDCMPWMKSSFKLSSSMDFKLINIENDQLGHKHYRYQQTYNGKPVEHAVWMLHSKNGKVYSMNGLIYAQLAQSNAASITEQAAMQKALDHVGANIYKWELPQEEAHLKRETGDETATYYPSGELVNISKHGQHTNGSFRLAYKFNIYAHEPVSRAYIYVDASTGEIIYEDEVFHHVDVTGTAQTAYSGVQTIIADSFGGSYRLRESGRGNGVNTYNMQQGTSYGASVDFTDTDNFWDNVNPQLDEYATDAHWGAEMTYDYFWLEHQRNSIDGNGFALNSYVHYDVNYANAFWDGQRMTYGDGNASWNPLTALDIAGHEVSHGLTTFTAGLVYQDESGALNESFSDIFGTSIENFARPTNWNWLIGEDIGSALRSMSNPGSYGDPDTYFGNNWAPLGGADNGGVHTNSGVQNFWYYLLVTGGTGTNDNGDAYTVNGIGFDNASDIAFRNLTVYLTASSGFADARFYAIQSAIDLFGGCTPEVEATTNAWYAVGVGTPYVSTIISNFDTPITSACAAPATFNFNNLSSNGTSFTWDFGDGNSSTAISPSHTYNNLGQYTVQLIADGGLCGIDTTTFVNYITIDTAVACIVNMPNNGTGTTQTKCDGTLFDSGGASGNYGPDEDAQITISPIGAATVDLNFVLFDVEAGQSGSCNYDYLEVYDGPSAASPLIDTYCNNNIPTTVSSTGASITIVFHSDGGVEDAGYQIDWSCNLPTVPPTADFTADADTTCNGEINFTDLSTDGPSQWLWDFGDGNSSTAQHPTHDYTVNGDYTVVLTATNVNGTDVMTKVNYIHVDLPPAPSGLGDNVCENNSAALTATGSTGSLNWYAAQNGGPILSTGANYNTSQLSTTTSFYVEEQFPGATQNLGPADNTFGGGGFFNGDQHLVFDCVAPVVLKTVKVYANGAGNRTIELRDNAGSVLQSAVVNIPDGEQTITLNFNIPVGVNLQLGTLNGSQQDLYRNNTGPSYPYTIGGGEVTITQASPGLDWYYFFYNWEIESPGCTSERTEVIATVTPQSDATIDPIAPLCLSDGIVALTAADAGGTWSGTGVSGTDFDPAVAGVGTHTIQYDITGMCGDTDQLDVVVSTSYDATINPSSVICLGTGPINLTAIDNGGVWSGTGITNASTGEFDPSVAGIGTHTVTYTISGSCGDTDTEDIIVDEAEDASMEPAGPFCIYEGVQQLMSTTPGGSWTADCGSCIDASTGEFDPSLAGTGAWVITYSIAGNCPSQSTMGIAVSDCAGLEDFVESQFSVFPNPSNGEVSIITDVELWNARIVDLSGKLVYSLLSNSGSAQIDLSNKIAAGTYFVQFEDINKGKTQNIKLVID